jgi:hypothetical protein
MRTGDARGWEYASSQFDCITPLCKQTSYGREMSLCKKLCSLRGKQIPKFVKRGIPIITIAPVTCLD